MFSPFHSRRGLFQTFVKLFNNLLNNLTKERKFKPKQKRGVYSTNAVEG